MASGVNSTFSQIGFAMSIAALGSIFASALRNHITVPWLRTGTGFTVPRGRLGHPPGRRRKAIASAPPALRGQLAAAIRSSFASGVDVLMVVTAVVAFVGATASLLLIRRKDFLTRQAPSEQASQGQELLTGAP
jgi:hypothetical protein